MEVYADLGFRCLYICLVKGRIQVFAGDGGSVDAPLTQNFNFDYL